MGPIDYTLNNAANPLQSFLGGMQGGLQIQGLRQEQEQRQQLAAAQELKLAAEQQKAQQESVAMERRQRYMDEMDRMRSEGFDPQKILELSTFMDKDTAQAMREGAESLSNEQQRISLGEMTDVNAAMISGNLDVARNIFTTKAAAYRNSPKPNEAKAQQMEAFLKGLEDDDPRDVILAIGSIMSQFPGGPEALKAIGEVQNQPFEQRELAAKATTAEVSAKYAETEKLLGLDAIRNDMAVKKVNSQIYAMNAALSREANDLKRQELGLRIDEKRQELNQIVRDKAAKAASGQEKLDRTLNTISRIESFEEGVLGSVLGPLDSRLPTISQKSADLEQLIDQLGSQAFLSAVAEAGSMAGMTETEGAKLQASAAQLSKAQSVKQFKANLVEFKKMLNKAKVNISGKYGYTQENQPGEPADIDALLNKYLPGGQ